MNSLGTTHRPQLKDTGLLDTYRCFRETIYQPLQKTYNRLSILTEFNAGRCYTRRKVLVVETWLHPFFTAALGGGGGEVRSASHPTCFDPVATATTSHWTACSVDPTDCLDTRELAEISFPCWKSNPQVPQSSSPQPVHYTNWSILAALFLAMTEKY